MRIINEKKYNRLKIIMSLRAERSNLPVWEGDCFGKSALATPPAIGGAMT
jgi:hypothetical protein